MIRHKIFWEKNFSWMIGVMNLKNISDYQRHLLTFKRIKNIIFGNRNLKNSLQTFKGLLDIFHKQFTTIRLKFCKNGFGQAGLVEILV